MASRETLLSSLKINQSGRRVVAHHDKESACAGIRIIQGPAFSAVTRLPYPIKLLYWGVPWTPPQMAALPSVLRHLGLLALIPDFPDDKGMGGRDG